MKAHKLFSFYSEKQLRNFYQEFLLIDPAEAKAYIEILPSGEIIFHAARREGCIFVHDLNQIFKHLDMVKQHGGLAACVEAKRNFGKWLHHKFLDAINDAIECERAKGISA